MEYCFIIVLIKLVLIAKKLKMKIQLIISVLCFAMLCSCKIKHREIPKEIIKTEVGENINDSLKKYKVENINDSCIKYLYGRNGFKMFSNSDSLLVGMCKYVPWKIRQENDSIVFIYYILYYQDTILMNNRFIMDENFHSFDINIRTQKIEKVFLGQETTYERFNDYLDEYNEEIRSQRFKNNFKKYFPKLHPEFKRLFAGMANKGAGVP